MPEGRDHMLPDVGADAWRSWLMTGARRDPIDRRRVRGENLGLKRLLAGGASAPSDRPQAWRDFSGAMVRHAVDEAVRSLPAEEAKVVKLAYFGGYSNRQIAVEVGLTEGTVQRRLRRALATISQHLQHGRVLARRAIYGFVVWQSGRLLSDSAHHFVQSAAVAATVTIIAAQPAPAAVAPASHSIAPRVPHAPPSTIAPAPPSLVPPAVKTQVPQVDVPSISLPITLPSPTQLPVKVNPLRA